MAISYAYPKAIPELQDLLIGTEIAVQGGEDAPRTRTFTIQSIVDLVPPTPPSGTLTGFFPYTQTPTWVLGVGGAAPSGATQHYYKYTKVGNLVTLAVWLDYAANGIETLEVHVPFPIGAPTPWRPPIAQNSGHILNYGAGTIVPGRAALSPAPGVCNLRLLNETTNTYELSAERDAGVNGQFVYMMISYFTD